MKTIKEQCLQAGISVNLYYSRIRKGMTTEQAFHTPVRKYQPRPKINITDDEANSRFEDALGGFNMVILKHVKRGEYRYQIT